MSSNARISRTCWRNCFVFAWRSSNANRSKSARDGEWHADRCIVVAVRCRGLRASASARRERTVRDRAISCWHNARLVERTTAARSKQSGDLRADRYAALDCHDANARVCNVAAKHSATNAIELHRYVACECFAPTIEQ